MKQQGLTESQIKWLRSTMNKSDSYEFKDGFVNVNGGIWADGNDVREKLTAIPVQFGEVTGEFHVRHNELISLKGCPHTIGKAFTCYDNQLTTLDYFPQYFVHAEIGFNPYVLNDKLFEDLMKLDAKNTVNDWFSLLAELKEQIPIQFGVTDENVIEEIWKSYEKIFTRK